MKTLLILLSLALSTSAYATGGEQNDPSQDQRQQQQQEMNQQQDQTVDVTTDVVVATDVVSDATANANNDLTIEGDTYDIPVSTAYAPTPYSHIRCSQYIGFGATRDDGSMSIGFPVPRAFSRKIKDCERVDNAAWLDSMGMRAEAIKNRCEIKSMTKQYGSAENCVDTLQGEHNNIGTIAMLNEKVQTQQRELLFVKEGHSKDMATEQAKCNETINRATGACKK